MEATDYNARLQRRIVAMLLAGNVPREYREYARLLRKVGVEKVWPRIEAGASRQDRYVMRYFRYFELIHQRSPAVFRLSTSKKGPVPSP